MTDEFPCRPDSDHWCVECCLRENCCLLGDTEDGKRGCMGHNKTAVIQKLPKCRERYPCFDQLGAEWTPKGEKEIRRIIFVFPPGEFKMSEIVKVYRGEIFEQRPNYLNIKLDPIERILRTIDWLKNNWRVIDINLSDYSGAKRRKMKEDFTPEDRARLYLYSHNKLKKGWLSAALGVAGAVIELLPLKGLQVPPELLRDYETLQRDVHAKDWMDKELVGQADGLLDKTKSFLFKESRAVSDINC